MVHHNIGIIIDDIDKDNSNINNNNDDVFSLSVFLDKLDSNGIDFGEEGTVKFNFYLIREISEDISNKIMAAIKKPMIVNNKEKFSFCFFYQTKSKRKSLELACLCHSLDIEYTVDRDKSIIPSESSNLDFIRVYYDLMAISTATKKTDWGMVPTALIDEVHRTKCIPERFWYWHEGSTSLWHKLNNSNYELTRETKALLESNIKTITNALFKERDVDFIDLGVGTPEKDEIIIKSLINKMSGSSKDNQLFFFPIDISFPLIEYTLRRILQIKNDGSLSHPLTITPILGDFERLLETDYQELLSEKRTKLITLLGNTIGNINEKDNFERISTLFGDDGYLLIDVEFCNNIKNDALRAQYYNQEVYNFVFHPLELIGEYDKGNYPNNFQQKMYVIVLDYENPQNSADDASLKIIKKHKISFSDGTISFTNNRVVSHQKITDIPKSKVVALFYKTNDNQLILMAWSTKYDEKEFENYLSHWYCVDQRKLKWTDPSNRYGLYLLTRKKD